MRHVRHDSASKLSTQNALVYFVIPVQFLVIGVVAFLISRKNQELQLLAGEGNDAFSSRYYSSGDKTVNDYRKGGEQSVISFWPYLRFSRPPEQELRCPTEKCNVEQWSYIGDKCYYRSEPIKDSAGHNSSIWSLVQDDMYYTEEYDFACPVSVCRKQWNEEINKTDHIVLRVLHEYYQNDTPWNLERMYHGNKYVRMNRFWGLEYKLNGGFTLTKGKDDDTEEVEEKNATITIRRGFTQKFCDVLVNTEVPPPESPIYIVVPYTGRVEQLQSFYDNLKDLVAEGLNLRVVVSTHGGAVHLLSAAETLREMQIGITEGEFADGHRVQVVETTGDHFGNFSRSKALLDGSQYVPSDALMFFCDVDMLIKKEFFDNCRYNTQQNYQVYYPIVYSMYPYGYKVEKEHGYWRSGAYGMLCVYKSDFETTEAWALHEKQKKLVGWGFEDVTLHQEFMNHPRISIFQAIEPNLLHRWHPKYCEFNRHIVACLGTVFRNLGSKRFLASLIAYNGVDVSTIPYTPEAVRFSPYKNETTGEIMGGSNKTDDQILEENGDHLERLKQAYEEKLKEGKIGFVSTLAKEAIEAKDRTQV
ncbi:Glycosyltransferase family GT7 [Gracilaria domingensis]|nr:Glycosyltransferase family GT7 [Gracilaria domingensis]